MPADKSNFSNCARQPKRLRTAALIDRDRGDPQNIMGVILDRDESDMYMIAVRAGLLKESSLKINFFYAYKSYLAIVMLILILKFQFE